MLPVGGWWAQIQERETELSEDLSMEEKRHLGKSIRDDRSRPECMEFCIEYCCPSANILSPWQWCFSLQISPDCEPVLHVCFSKGL